jgi:hypothetical protein
MDRPEKFPVTFRVPILGGLLFASRLCGPYAALQSG